MGAGWCASLVMTTWSHVRAALWGGDPLQFGERARYRHSYTIFGAHWLMLDPAARSSTSRAMHLPAPHCDLLLMQQPFGGPHDSPTYRDCDSRRYCTDAAFMISPMVL
ncbi:hypothetical protein BKH12_12590 [Actinomyces naeslundii]|nr:hypothetical protein BKH12_12590 [Actinomyces naeslundii]